MDLPDSQKKKPKKKAPSPRRDGREAALQYLYGHDIQGEVDFSEQSLSDFWELRLAKQPAQEFASKILVGIRDKLPLLDAAIRETLENFAFQRLTPAERNILRIGAYELLYDEEIPRRRISRLYQRHS